jgi:predicted transcriptional regulator
MNYKVNDLLYGFMRSLSTARPIYEAGKIVDYQEYLPKEEFMKNKKLIAAICGRDMKTIKRNLDRLFEVGLVEEGFEVVETVNKDGSIKKYEYPCYWFPYNRSDKYKIIEKDLVRYLVDTRNAQCIKVYLYLLNKYEYKSDYVFTIKEVQKALGYSGDSSTTVGNILNSLAREGIIRFEDDYDYQEKDGGIHKIPVKILKFVAKSVNQLRALD